jgi:hypothetical protein
MMAKTQKPQTYYEKFATPRELSREVQTEIRDLAKSLKGMAANLTMALEKDNATLLAKRCKDYAPDLVRMAAVLNSVASELE